MGIYSKPVKVTNVAVRLPSCGSILFLLKLYQGAPFVALMKKMHVLDSLVQFITRRAQHRFMGTWSGTLAAQSFKETLLSFKSNSLTPTNHWELFIWLFCEDNRRL
ncbi:hypothetical protein L6164_019856 [Bauhinia variegata]|uniref:Uncharacterized protein n=1 Tax=Bauhinia variegata TaxID=167791 RepID=A0ACB9MT53_BAUVA|nr:hypothetical protein L6164_019856 [Bauhinia variegata]